MDEILTSHVFDHFGKTFLLDKLDGPGARIRITEIEPNGPRKGRYAVIVNATVLKRVLEFAEAPIVAAPTAKVATVRRRPFFTGEQRDAMKKSYFKGVTSEALAVQYGCKAEDIEQALRKEGVEVVDQSLPTKENRNFKRPSSQRQQLRTKTRTLGPGILVEYVPDGTPWSVDEDTKLAELHSLGESIKGLATKFRRPAGIIRSRLQKLGLIK